MRKGGDGRPHITRESGRRHSNAVGICERCHTAFNARVEDWGAVKLRPLVAGSGQSLHFDHPDVHRLAAWCFKQIAIDDLTEPPAMIPEAHRRYFAGRVEPPPSVAIWVGTVENIEAGWFIVRSQMTVRPGGGPSVMTIYCFTARAGSLFFQVIGPMGGARPDLGRVAADVCQIWPPADAVKGWETAQTTPMTDERFVEAARLSMEWVPDTRLEP